MNKEMIEEKVSDGNDSIVDLLQVGNRAGVKGIEVIRPYLEKSAELFRVNPVEASKLLVNCLDNLTNLFKLIEEIKFGLNLHADFEQSGEIHQIVVKWDELLGLFKELYAAMEGKDWITLADLIEYELLSGLESLSKDFSDIDRMLIH